MPTPTLPLKPGDTYHSVTLVKELPRYIHVIGIGIEERATSQWIVRCACGVEWKVRTHRLIKNWPRGCKTCVPSRQYNKLPRSRLHKSGHPSYGSWYAMIRRCNDPKHDHYKYYGARGITVDPRWLNFDEFVKDMGERPQGLTLDRIHSGLGYAKWNCRWATPAVQARNRSRTYAKRTPK